MLVSICDCIQQWLFYWLKLNKLQPKKRHSPLFVVHNLWLQTRNCGFWQRDTQGQQLDENQKALSQTYSLDGLTSNSHFSQNLFSAAGKWHVALQEL